MVVLVWASPAWAIPISVDKIRYDDATRRLSFDVTGPAEILTRQVDRRLIFEMPDARIRGKTYAGWPPSRRIRSIIVSEVAGNPPLVRIELFLAPGLDPQLSIQQAAGHVDITLSDPPPQAGERDLEAFPIAPIGPMPAISDRSNRPPRIRQAVTVPTPPPSPLRQTTQQPTPPVPPPQRPQPTYGMRAPEPIRNPGSKSYALLQIQQAEALEDIPNARVVGFPTGPSGIEARQWFGTYFGAGGELRYYSWTARGALTQARTEGLLIAEASGRFPIFGWIEPDASLGLAVRFQAIDAASQVDFTPLVGLGVRFQAPMGIDLRIWGQAFPLGLGQDGLYRLGGTLFVDAGPAIVSLGYSQDEIVDRRGPKGHTTYGAVKLGTGFQW